MLYIKKCPDNSEKKGMSKNIAILLAEKGINFVVTCSDGEWQFAVDRKYKKTMDRTFRFAETTGLK